MGARDQEGQANIADLTNVSICRSHCFVTFIPYQISLLLLLLLFFFFGRENPIATTVGFDCISITFKVASAAVGDLPRPYRFKYLFLSFSHL